LQEFRATRAGAVLVASALEGTAGGPATRIIVADPAGAINRAARAFAPAPQPEPGVDPTARVGPGVRVPPEAWIGPYAILEMGVRLGSGVRIGAGAFLGAGTVIGDDCEIGPHAVCYPGTTLGDRVVLKAGAVIGGPGFGYLRGPDGHVRVPHTGQCVLESDVEVGSGSCVDRGSFDDTVIGRGTKIDNLVQVGHNVRIGQRCLIMATSGIAGSCRIGDDVTIAGGVGIADHVNVGDGAVIGAKSVVFGPGEVTAGAVVTGYPARPHRQFLRAQAAVYRLAPLAARLERLAVGEAHVPADDRPGG
jgi:UDP-3-O-[3-hydroxymyristoyl] glucosamine N-acyltransferase